MKWIFAVLVAVLPSLLLSAQQPTPNSVALQSEAMRKLAFLEGKWSGPVTVVRGPGEPLRMTQTEQVEYKLDGLALLIEGESTGADGKIQFRALATIAYDDASHKYHIRAYNDGHYVDTELTVADKGFSWSFDSGPAHVVNTMHVTDKGEWNEVTDVSFRGGPAHRSMEMSLQRQP